MEIKEEPVMLEIGNAEVVKNFSDNGKRKVAFFGLGPMFSVAKAAADELGEDFDCALIDPRFTKHTPLMRVGWPDQFIEHASSVGELREKYGLTAKAVVAQIKGESKSMLSDSSEESAVA